MFFYYFQGCYEVLTEYLTDNLNILFGIAIGTALLPLLGAMLSCSLARYIEKSKYDVINWNLRSSNGQIEYRISRLNSYLLVDFQIFPSIVIFLEVRTRHLYLYFFIIPHLQTNYYLLLQAIIKAIQSTSVSRLVNWLEFT